MLWMGSEWQELDLLPNPNNPPPTCIVFDLFTPAKAMAMASHMRMRAMTTCTVFGLTQLLAPPALMHDTPRKQHMATSAVAKAMPGMEVRLDQQIILVPHLVNVEHFTPGLWHSPQPHCTAYQTKCMGHLHAASKCTHAHEHVHGSVSPCVGENSNNSVPTSTATCHNPVGPWRI